jgi:hypothetical protein
MGNADYSRHIYRLSKGLKSYSIFDLQEVQKGSQLLTDSIGIEKYRGYSNASDISDYLRLRDCNNWAKCEKVTGLRATKKKGVFHGNRNNGVKSLILFQYSEDKQTLVLDVFRAFYPYHIGILEVLIRNHAFAL